MRKLAFYNHFHNGDLFASHAWIKDICSKLDYEPEYLHKNSFRTMLDLPIVQTAIPDHWNDENIRCHKFVATPETIFVNTWIGAYLKSWSTDGIPVVGDDTFVNYLAYHNMWKFIYNMIKNEYQLDLNMSDDVWKYIGDPDYQKYDIQSIDAFISGHPSKIRVLISNGPTHSSQSHQRHNMEHIMLPLIKKYNQTQFIFTHKTSLDQANVFYTDDIISIFSDSKCDLQEIGHLSGYCDIIIGRNSGPFCFCMTTNNLLNPSKTFIAMDRTQTHCWPFGMSIPSNFYYLDDFDDGKLFPFIDTIMHSQHTFR